jgi:hypothetical protein
MVKAASIEAAFCIGSDRAVHEYINAIALSSEFISSGVAMLEVRTFT